MLVVGKLTSNATAAQRKVDSHGHFAPTLCFEVESMNGLHRSQVQQFFPVGHDAECEAAAKKLTKGMTVSYEVPITNIVQKHLGVSHVQEAQPDDLFAPEVLQLPAPAHA